jgi:hypothetical protein
VIAAAAGKASAQQERERPERPHLAPRAGMNFDGNDPLVGIQFVAPITSRLEFYPSTDVYFPDHGTRMGFNGDVRYRVPASRSLAFYGGTGLNITSRQVGTTSTTDPGMNLLGGVEARKGWVHPFLEGRATLRDDSFFQAVTGLSITLGRP